MSERDVPSIESAQACAQTSGQTPSDLELLDRARRGDNAAFDAWAGRHAPSLLRMAYGLVGQSADAEDVVQETLTAAFLGMARFEGRSQPRTWLIRILFNQASKWRRSKRVRRAVQVEEHLDVSVSPDGDAARRVEAEMDLADLLSDLTAEHREVILLREMEGLSYDEMATLLSLPRGTIESRLFRARQALSEKLKEYHGS